MKKQFKITRFPETSTIGDDVANICAKSNGSQTPLTIAQIASWVECEKVKYPTSHKNIMASVINQNLLTLDDNKVCVLEIELVIFEDAPTLDRQEK